MRDVGSQCSVLVGIAWVLGGRGKSCLWEGIGSDCMQARAYCNSSETSCMHVGNGNYLYLLRHSYM